MSELEDYPNWPEIDNLMSNFDREVDQDVAQRLQTEQVIANYPGWNFNAYCWFKDGLFYAAVRRYGTHVATISAETPAELMENVSNEFGWD
jgi:hypothetical protein